MIENENRSANNNNKRTERNKNRDNKRSLAQSQCMIFARCSIFVFIFLSHVFRVCNDFTFGETYIFTFLYIYFRGQNYVLCLLHSMQTLHIRLVFGFLFFVL